VRRLPGSDKIRNLLSYPPAIGFVVIVLAGLGTWAAFTATTSNAGSSFAAASSDAPPTISRATVQRASSGGAGYLKNSEAFYAYAQVTDDVGVSSVTGNFAVASNVIATGETNNPFTTTGGPWTVGGQTYNYQSTVAMVSDAGMATGPKTFTVTAQDSISQVTGPSDFTATIDNTAPTRVRSVIRNTADTYPGYVKQGQDYHVYAEITDAGSGPGSVYADVARSGTVITTTGGLRSMTTSGGPWTIDGLSYNYRTINSATADNPLTPDGSKTYRISAYDNVDNVGNTNYSVIADSTGPVITSTIEKSSSSGGAGYLKSSTNYYVYANATDAAPPNGIGATDTSSLTAVDTNVNSTGSSTPFSLVYNAGGYSVGGTTYYYRSASTRLAKAGLTTTTYSVTGSDTLGNSSTNSTLPLTADNTIPVITGNPRTCGGTTCTAAYVASSKGYVLYADVSDAGSGIASVSADLSSITTGATSVALTPCLSNCTVGVAGNYTTFNYKSAAQTSNVSPGSSFDVTRTDNVGNTATSNYGVTSDTTPPSPGPYRICPTQSCTGAFVKAGQPYYVYASPTDVSGIESMTVDVSAITSGQTAVPMTACSSNCTVGVTTYTYKSAQLTADGGLSNGATPQSTFTTTDGALNIATTNFNTTVDNTAPTISATLICGPASGGCTASYVGSARTYYVYANASDASSGIDSLTADLSNIDNNGGGSTAISMPACASNCVVGGVTYGYKSAQKTSANLTNNATPAFSVTATDSATTTATANSTANVRTTQPAASDVQTTNFGATVGKPEATDKITFTYLRIVDPTSIIAGWTGSSTNVVVRIDNSGTNDLLYIYDSTNTNLLAVTSSVALSGNYVTANRTWGASGTASTMVLSGNTPTTITVTLGTVSATSSINTVGTTGTMSWVSGNAIYDWANNPILSSSTATESGSADVEF